MKKGADMAIAKMLQMIPLTETKLRTILQKYKDKLEEIHPLEMRNMHYCWKPVQQILIENVENIDCEWKRAIIHIYNA